MNVMFLCLDRYRWDALGCAHNSSAATLASGIARAANEGGPLARTKNRDRVTLRGTLFSDVVRNCALCLPSVTRNEECIQW